MPTKELARTLGLLPQSPIAPEGIAVADLVARGRHPHQRLLSRWSADDDAAVAEALELTETADLADRSVDELSGGQRQRVWIAMALAQQTDILLLDEPTTFLDVSHQIDVLDLLTDLNRDRGTTIVMVLHDLNLAARYADHLVAVADGRLHAAGDAGRGADRGGGARGLRPGQPGRARPGLRAAAGAADRSPPHQRPRPPCDSRPQRRPQSGCTTAEPLAPTCADSGEPGKVSGRSSGAVRWTVTRSETGSTSTWTVSPG